MLRRLFVKETFEHIEEELRSVYQVLGIEAQELKVRKQAATYSKPYSYIAEGSLEGHHFVLSLRHTPLKVQDGKQQLELILQCENSDWRTLVFRKKNAPQSNTKKILGIEGMTQLKNVNLDKLIIESSDMDWTERLFDLSLGKKAAIMAEIKFSSFVLERKRLYIQMPWLPDDFSKRQALVQILDFSISLIKKIDT
ncbi:MAG: Unknown protein [uncultured Aureispira sp.]|uniref:DUF3156 family protein n=1 Tax=uncultured Aureispira sp. TaxID=1331704 RepID=A0A6S6ULW1_9BACT|nr:MAG: Unknown protein [uncultured Aureispira sp.]